MNAAPFDSSGASAAVTQFLHFTQNADAEELKKVIRDRAIPPERFFSVIPKPAAEFALILRTPIMFETLLSQAPAGLQDSLREAKSAADTRLSGIEDHPAVMEMVRNRFKSGSQEGLGKPSVLTEFGSFNATPLWIESEDALVPIASIVLQGLASKVLLRVTVDPEDLSFLGLVFIELLRDELKRAAKMAETRAVEVPYKDVISQRLNKIEMALRDLKQIASGLQFPVAGN
jgi:hypothetical protein